MNKYFYYLYNKLYIVKYLSLYTKKGVDLTMKMNIQENNKIFSKTCIIKKNGNLTNKGEDKLRLDKIRKYFINLCKNESWTEFFLNQHKYIVKLFVDGELDDEYLDICKNKKTFKNDRGYIDENGNLISEDWFTCFFLLISKLEEVSTLFKFNKFCNCDFYLEDNPDASDFTSREATSDPDFIMKDKEGNTIGYVEQKVVKNNDNFMIRIRISQYRKFYQMINEGKKIYVLCKYENIDEGYDVYYFYDYKKICNKLTFNNYTYKYEVNNQNVIPDKFFVDVYKK